jgi:PAB-dependent poly(A)-specific ribonuclease subunit 3
VIDKNGTHYFGSNAAISNNFSWVQRGGLNNDNNNHTALNTNTTVPARHHPQNNHRTLLHTSSNSTAATLLNSSSNNNSLSLPLEEYHHYRILSNQSAQEMDPNDIRHKAVPPSFTHAYCLDDDTTLVPSNKQQQHQQQRSSFGYPTSLFRVTSISDGKLYVLRRLDSVRCVSHKIAQTVMYQWLSNINGREDGNSIGGGFDHPGVVRWYKCFISQRAVFFIHHYHPGSVTLRERFFSHHPPGQMSTNGVGVGGVPLPEPLIWSCLTQLVSAIRAVHGNNLAVRTLQLNHILCTQENNTSAGPYGLPKLRYRINCIGIVDILEFESRKGLEELQEMDMRSLGCILLSMTTGTEINISDLYTNGGQQHQQQQQQEERILYEYMKFVQQNYSRDLYTIVQSLLHPNTPPANIQSVASSMAMHAFDELDDAYICIDERHTSLIGIYESGRALQLVLKLAFVNERPEFGIDTNWSESGDCYILKLFRDYGE